MYHLDGKCFGFISCTPHLIPFLLTETTTELYSGYNVGVRILRAVSVSVSLSLFHCVCLSTACNPSLCRAKGRGLQPKGLRVKETADFKVYTKGAGTGELKVSIKGPSELHCKHQSCFYCCPFIYQLMVILL